MAGSVVSIRDAVRPLLWGLALSLVLNIAYVVINVLKTTRQAKEEGLAAVAFSLPWFVVWTVVGALCIAPVIILTRRALH